MWQAREHLSRGRPDYTGRPSNHATDVGLREIAALVPQGLARHPRQRYAVGIPRDRLMAVSYSVNGDTFVAERPLVWIAKLGGTAWDLAPDGERVTVLIPEGSAQAPSKST